MAKLGIIGGSGIYNIDGFKEVKELKINTPYGNTSDLIKVASINDFEVVFIARHGKNHSLLPTEVPYKANIWALKSLDVKWLISASAVGSLRQEIKPLDFVIPDQFIDRTMQRPLTFFGEGVVAHISLAQPFCPALSNIVGDVAEKFVSKERKVHRGGTYICMEGPAFSTKAESELYRSWGCSIIGMTNHTEARLAKEAEIAYTSLAMSTDYDCWHPEHESVTVEMLISNLQSNAELAKKVIKECAKKISILKPKSDFHDALQNALLTDKKTVPKKTLKRIEPIIKKYWY